MVMTRWEVRMIPRKDGDEVSLEYARDFESAVRIADGWVFGMNAYQGRVYEDGVIVYEAAGSGDFAMGGGESRDVGLIGGDE